ncbi:MAG: hypothetical protein WAX69_08605 [Victivallales bacterium]
MRTIFTAVLITLLGVSGLGQADQPNAGTGDSDVIAIVLGRKVTAKEKNILNRLIFKTLLDQYAKENKIEPTEEELNTFLEKADEKERQLQAKYEGDVEKLQMDLKSQTLSDQERKNKESQLQALERLIKIKREAMERTKGMEEMMKASKRQVAMGFIKAWKVNKALYAKYGGRVIFQQAGPEPLDAYRDFLKEQEKNGAFQIIDKSYEAPFWKYFIDDSMHKFYSKDEGEKFINTPWWMMEIAPEKAEL